uniref:WGS project CAEQ00000000 data, annotated contig 390 n=1 Tax=Trypanosoma congolense (strain IL3000) TaxID=1068625 RepID=F9WFI4_TRYCI|nr:unnamed protein product [Trypanosoma congolense IL3000]
MQVSVLASSGVLSSCGRHGTSILVGQRSSYGSSENLERTVHTVLETVPCEELEVISEQMDCLEQILPCGIELLGLVQEGDEVQQTSKLRSFLTDRLKDNLIVLFVSSDRATKRCALLQTNEEVALEVLDTVIPFITLPCYLFSPLSTMPIILRRGGSDSGDGVLIDLTSTRLLQNTAIWRSEDINATQLGGRNDCRDLVCVNITFAPLYSCGADIYKWLLHFVQITGSQLHARVLRVQSLRSPLLTYQLIYSSTDTGGDNPSKKQLKQLGELMEDGSGEKLIPSQIVAGSKGFTAKVSLSSSRGDKTAMTTEDDIAHAGGPIAGKSDNFLSVHILIVAAGVMGLLACMLHVTGWQR